MISIKLADVEEFLKMVENIYGRDYIINQDIVRFLKHKGTYMLNYDSVYYEVQAVEYTNGLDFKYGIIPVRYGFNLLYYLLERIVSTHKKRNDESILLYIPNEKICCGKKGILETKIGHIPVDIYSNEFDELEKGFQMELKAKDLLEFVQKNGKITIEVKILDKVYAIDYNFYFFGQQGFENFISYLKPEKVIVYFNDYNAFVRIENSLYCIDQWIEEDL